MTARMEKTRHPGIYKRGSRYVVAYWVDVEQREPDEEDWRPLTMFERRTLWGFRDSG